MVRNKPNSRWARYPSVLLFYHSTIPGRCQLCKTKPNVGKQGYLGAGWVMACGTRRVVQTNPIFLRAKRRASALRERSYGDLYLQGAWEKQTQLPEAGHRGGVRLCRAGRGQRGAGRGRIVRNKAKLGQDGTSGERRIRQANSAKQSQFRGLVQSAKRGYMFWHVARGGQSD